MQRLLCRLGCLSAVSVLAAWAGFAEAGGAPVEITLDGAENRVETEARRGTVRIRLHYRAPDKAAGTPRAPMLDVYEDDRRVLRIEDEGNSFEWPTALAQIVEMDKANPYPEVVFATYSGGAHCCSTVRIATSSADGSCWYLVEAEPFDGEPRGAEDADGDGLFEIVHPDNRFLYRFSSYASSAAPARVVALEGRRLADVGFETRFKPLHRRWLTDLQPIVDAIAGEPEKNGYLAGYVALKNLLGEGPEAWQYMLANHDRRSDWDLSECTGGYDADNNCLKTTTYKDYPTALHAFLKRTGYFRQSGRCVSCSQ